MLDWRIDVWSSPDHDDLVAEIYLAGQFVALVDQEDGPDNLRISFAPNADVLGRMPLDQFESAIQQAKNRLDKLRRQDP